MVPLCPPFPQLYRKQTVTWEHVPFVALYALAAYLWVSSAGVPYEVRAPLCWRSRRSSARHTNLDP